MQGFIQSGGGGIPPPSRNLEIEYGFVTGIKQQSCLRLRQKQFERIQIQNFPGGRGGGACPQTPLVGMHAHTCMRAFMRYYHPASILFFFSQLKILYETLAVTQSARWIVSFC